VSISVNLSRHLRPDRAAAALAGIRRHLHQLFSITSQYGLRARMSAIEHRATFVGATIAVQPDAHSMSDRALRLVFLEDLTALVDHRIDTDSYDLLLRHLAALSAVMSLITRACNDIADRGGGFRRSHRNPLGFSATAAFHTARHGSVFSSPLAPFGPPDIQTGKVGIWNGHHLETKGVSAGVHIHGNQAPVAARLFALFLARKQNGFLPTKPGPTPTSTAIIVGSLAAKNHRQVATRHPAGVFRAHDFFQQFPITFQASKNVSPITSSGRLVNRRDLRPMVQPDVFVARIAPGSSRGPASVKNLAASAPCLRTPASYADQVPPGQRVPSLPSKRPIGLRTFNLAGNGACHCCADSCRARPQPAIQCLLVCSRRW